MFFFSTTNSAAAAAIHVGRSGRNEELQRQLRWIVIAWMFGSLWLYTISGAAMTQFARGLGLPDAGFGVLAALPFFGTLFQLPASFVQERFGHRKAFFMVTAGIHRLLWTVAALIPWVVPREQVTLQWSLLLGLLTVSWICGSMSGPGFTSLFGDVVPRRIRGRYMGIRQTVTLPLAVGVTLGVGAWLRASELNGGADLVLAVSSFAIGVAGVLGVLDILCFLFVRDPNPSHGERDTHFLHLLSEPLRQGNFRRYLAYNFTLMLAMGFLGQYTWLFAFDEAKLSPLTANLLLIVLPLVMRAATYPLWGRLVDRLGKKPVLLISGAMILFAPLGWLLVTEELIWPGYLLTLLWPAAFPGIEIANFNFILDLSTTRKGQRGGSAYVAINSIVTGVGGVLSGVIGAVVAASVPDLRLEWKLTMPWQDAVGIGPAIIVTYHGLLFMLSTALCLAALVWAATLREPRATGTREAIRYMTGGVYSNVRQGLLLPTRVVGRLHRQAYRLPSQNPKRK